MVMTSERVMVCDVLMTSEKVDCVWCVVMTSERVEVCGVAYFVVVMFRIVLSSPKSVVCDL